ncbi:hypothetical protein PCASD_08143 [Puccinia coronata f. sp. avenae]|uniref:Uncharacterized protein n=1 Tax=Puccinia coronata f. sp. avenae TaxID=200324 RepID=A0A2N5VAA6_9BASI|nr:hypothetical protein PCASD_08143 [Puccinia coronata f. sp. avenae]
MSTPIRASCSNDFIIDPPPHHPSSPKEIHCSKQFCDGWSWGGLPTSIWGTNYVRVSAVHSHIRSPPESWRSRGPTFHPTLPLFAWYD